MTTEIQEYSQTEAALAVLRDQYDGATYDVVKAEGMKQAKEARAEVRGYRTALENMRKDIKAPALERCRLIDSEAKRITAELLKLEKPIDDQIKEQEKKVEARRQAKIRAEERRVETIQEHLSDLRDWPTRAATRKLSCEELDAWVKDLTAVDISEERFEEFIDQAKDAKAASLASLKEMREVARAHEEEQAKIAAERAELEKLRKEREEREAKERAEREAKEADERKARAAEEEKKRKELEAQRKAQEEEQRRLDEEREQFRKEQEATEQKKREEAKLRAEAEEAARKAHYPGEPAIVAALTEYFGVTEEVVRNWLTEMRKAA